MLSDTFLSLRTCLPFSACLLSEPSLHQALFGCVPSLLSHALQGYIGPGKEQVLKVYYLPGVPGVFCRTFQIQVGHLEPEEISLKGEGSFPRIYLDLPRNIKGEYCLSAPQEGPLVFPPRHMPIG